MRQILLSLFLTLSIGVSAQIKVSQLPNATPLSGPELVNVVQDGTSKKTTVQEIANLNSGTTLNQGPGIVIQGGVIRVDTSFAATRYWVNYGYIPTPLWSNVSGKPSSFPPSAHTHAVSELSQSGATNGQVLVWNGTGWVPQTISGGSGSTTWGSITGTLASQTDLNSALAGKQAILVSGTNIKTVDSQSILGPGNITTRVNVPSLPSNTDPLTTDLLLIVNPDDGTQQKVTLGDQLIKSVSAMSGNVRPYLDGDKIRWELTSNLEVPGYSPTTSQSLATKGYVDTLVNGGDANSYELLTDTNWDGSNKYKILSANTNVVLTTVRNSGSLFVQNASPGGFTLNVNGNDQTIDAAADAWSEVKFRKLGAFYVIKVEDSWEDLSVAAPGSYLTMSSGATSIGGTFVETVPGTFLFTAGGGRAWALADGSFTGDGYVRMIVNSPSTDAAVIGLDEDNTLEPWDEGTDPTIMYWKWALYSYMGTYWMRDAAGTAFIDTGIPAVNGHFVEIRKTGTVVEAFYSPDGTSWTSIGAFATAATSSGTTTHRKFGVGIANKQIEELTGG